MISFTDIESICDDIERLHERRLRHAFKWGFYAGAAVGCLVASTAWCWMTW